MREIDIEEAKKLVKEILSKDISGEYPWLDFKLEFQKSPVKLVHDILCLSNTRHNGMRFIIYGVENASWILKGLHDDLVSDQIHGIVNGIVWNHKPIILVDHVHVHKMKFGFIAVADTPTKPHYLRKPYNGIPSGAVYTRQGDTNTPFKGGNEVKSVEDGELELMFRERFGIDKPLLEKLEILLAQTEKWNEFSEGDISGYFHQDFPEYQIRLEETCLDDENSGEGWVELHQKQTGQKLKDTPFSRVRRISNLFDWGKRFSVYFHSTPVHQNGALIWLYKAYCPYPNLLESSDGRFQIRTNLSTSRSHKITYYVGAILCLKNRSWVHHVSDGNEPTGAKVFQVYNAVMRHNIDVSRSEHKKEPMLVLDVDAG